MAGIDPTLIKFYQCETWPEGSTHGGPPSAVEITTGISENIFDHIQPGEPPDTEYRKVWVKNTNGEVWPSVIGYISQLTAWEKDEIDINMSDGTWGDTEVDAQQYTFYRPTAPDHQDVFPARVYDSLGNLQNTEGNVGQDEFFLVWIRRTVQETTEGYTNNSFKLTFVSV